MGAVVVRRPGVARVVRDSLATDDCSVAVRDSVDARRVAEGDNSLADCELTTGWCLVGVDCSVVGC